MEHRWTPSYWEPPATHWSRTEARRCQISVSLDRQRLRNSGCHLMARDSRGPGRGARPVAIPAGATHVRRCLCHRRGLRTLLSPCVGRIPSCMQRHPHRTAETVHVPLSSSPPGGQRPAPPTRTTAGVPCACNAPVRPVCVPSPAGDALRAPGQQEPWSAAQMFPCRGPGQPMAICTGRPTVPLNRRVLSASRTF